MEQTHAFLLELGLEINAVFNDKITFGSSTDGIQMSLDTEGGDSSEFDRWTKLLELPIDLETDFIPVDLFDFENKEDDDGESSAQKSPTQRSQSKAFFVENKRLTNSRFLKEEKEKHWSERHEEYVSDTFKVSDTLGQHEEILRGGNDSPFFEEKQKPQRPNVGEVPNLPDVDTVNAVDAEANRNAAIKSQPPNVGEVSNLPDVDALNAVDTDVQSAIWQNPLGNLSNFAALSNSITPTTTPMDLSFLSNNQTRYDKPNTEEKTIEEEVFGQKREHIDTATARQRQPVFENKEESNKLFSPYFDNMVYEKKQMLYQEDTVENDDFLPINKETTLAADTDDLLDALTERIRRDFNRFYP